MRGCDAGTPNASFGCNYPPPPPTPVPLTWVLQLPADNFVHQQGLSDNLGALSLLDGLRDEEEVSEEEAVDVHLWG